MRYYKITVTPKGGGDPVVYTNKVNGKPDLGAPQVELDIPTGLFATPVGNALVTVWGVSLKTISQASDFNGAEIEVLGGMQAGLPLATAAASQAGLLLKGMVQQAYGYWQGTDQRIVFVVVTDGGFTQGQPGNIVLNWKKGQTLGDALQQTLSTAYPDATLSINVNPKLVLSEDDVGYFQTIEQLGQYVNNVSRKAVDPHGTGNYPGVNISRTGDTISAFDGTVPASAITLKAQDFIGQPTWLGAFQLQWSMVMRADLQIGSLVTFPQVLALQTQSTPQSQTQARDKTTFQGTFSINNVRHVGNSRAPDASGWVTTFIAFFQSASSAATDLQDNAA